MNIVMSSDYDYQFMYVAIRTILVSKKEDTTIVFHLLVSNEFGDEARIMLISLIEPEAKVIFYYPEKYFGGIKSHVDWISHVTYYRLMIPSLLNNCDKCLYLDADIVVLKDLSELYEIDIKDYFIAGVYALAYQDNSMEWQQKMLKKSGLLDYKQYVNAGVMLMNLKALRNYSFEKKSMLLAAEDLPSQDQDIMNRLCYGHIKVLPFKYNVMTKYHSWERFRYKDLYTDDEIYEAWAEPYIVHFADGDLKPWNNITAPYAAVWWSFCIESEVWGYYKNRNKDLFIYELFFKNTIRDYDWEIYKRLNCLLIYGAGQTAKKFIYIARAHGVSISGIIVTSMEANEESVLGINVCDIFSINKYPKDATIVIAMERNHSEVLSELLSRGYWKVWIYAN